MIHRTRTSGLLYTVMVPAKGHRTVVQGDGQVVLKPQTLTMDDLFGMFRDPDRPTLSTDEINQGISLIAAMMRPVWASMRPATHFMMSTLALAISALWTSP